MRYAQSSSMSGARWFLFAFALQVSTAWSQSQMSAEDEAIYRKMVESAGVDPDVQMAAIKQNEEAQQWTDAEVIHYHIVGVYQGQPNLSSEPGTGSGFADVTDRVEIELDWKLAESTLAGTPVIANSKSVVTNPHDAEPSCLPPILQGEYEHFDLLEIKDGLGGALELQVQTTYPALDVVQFCTGSRKTIAAGREIQPETLVVPSPVLLGMALPDSDNLRLSPDKQSMIQQQAGWTWTFTPSVKQ